MAKISPLLQGKLYQILMVFSIAAIVVSCKKQENQPGGAKGPQPPPAPLQIYKPKAMQNMDWNSDTSQWCYSRSKQSAHFIVFWDRGYGANIPSAANVPAQYRVDIDSLLQRAESFYNCYTGILKFATVGANSSKLDKYKMMIFLYYQDDWLATGLGYDDVIGALWVSPTPCQPVGATLAHEVGHAFQYQVGCDLGVSHGYRWGYGSLGLNTFWEQCAQWQAYQLFPNEAFGGWFPGYINSYNKHILHEDYRYSSYFIQYYWTQKHGIDFIGKLWRQSQSPEDAIQTYQRLTGISNDQFNDEIYDASARMVTWDLDSIRANGQNYIGAHWYKMNYEPDGSFQPDPAFCPQTTGYNVIPLNVSPAGTQVAANFKGIPNAPGYNPVDAGLAGWRYGFVALLKDGARVYGAMSKNATGIAQFTVPANCDKLWFVVTGAPVTYNQHAWDNDNTNDEQWPYNVKFANTNVYGYVNNNSNTPPTSVSFNFNVSIAHDTVNYAYTSVKVDLPQLTNAFQLNPDQITAKLGTDIKFYALEPNNNLNGTTTANGYGHWFDANGYVVNWGATSLLYSEFNAVNFNFNVGQYPGHVKAGDQYVLRQALVYTTPDNKVVQATFTFNVSVQ